MRRVLVAVWLLSGCNIVEELLGEEPNCSPRQAFYPDQDADGVGDPGAVYIGCDAPEGWVVVPPPGEDTDDSDVVDTDPVDTDPIDTDPVDTDPIDTDPVDTDPIDTDPADTDP